MAECFNSKIKLFRVNLRSVIDKKFFLFRIANIYAFPHYISTDPIFMLSPIKFLLTPKSRHTACTYNKKAFQNWKTFAEREGDDTESPRSVTY